MVLFITRHFQTHHAETESTGHIDNGTTRLGEERRSKVHKH